MDVMIDLELAGTSSNGAIVSIGACPFERHGPLPTWEDVQAQGFEVRVGLQSAINAGGEVDGNAWNFWLRQSEEARLRLLEEPHSLTEALSMTRRFLMDCAGGNHKDLVVWSKPASGDLVILANAYKALGKPEPWLGKNRRCLSTLMAETGGRSPESAIARGQYPELVHIALFDCWLQILDARHALSKIGGPAVFLEGNSAVE